MGTVIKNMGTSCVGVRKTGTTLIRVSTVMGTLYFEMVYSQICVLLRKYESEEVYDKVGKYFDWLEKK